MAELESSIQKKLIKYMEERGWYVKITHGNLYQQGFPDLYCTHPKHWYRWIDVKRPKGSVLTKYQVETWTQWEKHGIKVFCLDAADQNNYDKLFNKPNWRSYRVAKSK